VHFYFISCQHKRFQRSFELFEGDVRLPKLFSPTVPQRWPAVAKQRSPNWLRDLLTKHVRLSADGRGRQPAAVTSVFVSYSRYPGAVPASVLRALW